MKRYDQSIKLPAEGLVDMTAVTSLRALISLVAARVPKPHHTGVAYYREWAGVLQVGVEEGDGPGDGLSVTWCDGDLCVCLPELIRFLGAQEKKASKKSAMECYREFVKALITLEELGREGLPEPV